MNDLFLSIFGLKIFLYLKNVFTRFLEKFMILTKRSQYLKNKN